MLAALHRHGLRTRTVVLRPRSATALRLEDARVALVDTVAATAAAPRLPALRARGTRVVALALMSAGALVLARRADRVIVPSAVLRDELMASGVAAAKISVVAPGRDAIAPSDADGDTRRVLCVANWSPAKGIHTLVSAMATVPEARLDLVGDASDRGYAARVRRMLARPALAGRVRRYGSLGGAALEKRYRRASVFALPSARESYGMALAAALAHGLPCVACDIPATREIAGDAALLVPPGRSRPLADALRSVLTDEDLRARLRSRALRRARSFPTWQESEEAFVRVVRSELAIGL